MKKIKLVIDNNTLSKYEDYYFTVLHPKAKKKPIPFPYHESINKWMIMKRPMMNALKQKWKDFIIWFIEDQGYTNLLIEKCQMEFKVFYGNNRRHDNDNTVPKFILDGLALSGFIVDDDNKHLTKLSLESDTDVEHPRTEITIKILSE